MLVQSWSPTGFEPASNQLAATLLPHKYFQTRLKACNYCMQELQRVACNNCTWNHNIRPLIILWSPYGIFLPCDFYLLLLSFPCLISAVGDWMKASVKHFEFGVRTPGGLFLGVRYAGGVDFRRFRTPSLSIFGVVLGLLETTKMYSRPTLYIWNCYELYERSLFCDPRQRRYARKIQTSRAEPDRLSWTWSAVWLAASRDPAKRALLWSPYVIGQTIIFSSCSFFLPSFLLSLSAYIFANKARVDNRKKTC